MKPQIENPSSDPVERIMQEEQKRVRMSEAHQALEDCRAVMEGGHFWFGKKGTREERHGRVYVNPRRIFNKTFTSKFLVNGLVDAIPSEIREQVEIVAGPQTGGIIVAHDLAEFLSSKSRKKTAEPQIEALFLSKDWNEVYWIKPDDEPRLVVLDDAKTVVRSKRVLVVDDVRHRGQALAVCVLKIQGCGGEVLATAELVDRGMKVLPLPSGVPNFFVAQTESDELYKPADCPMCKAGEKFTEF